MANKCVAFYTDNAAIVDIITHQTSTSLAMILVRDLVLTSLKYNTFQAHHIPGMHNTGADYL